MRPVALFVRISGDNFNNYARRRPVDVRPGPYPAPTRFCSQARCVTCVWLFVTDCLLGVDQCLRFVAMVKR
jgi:hypothetical protein